MIVSCTAPLPDDFTGKRKLSEGAETADCNYLQADDAAKSANTAYANAKRIPGPLTKTQEAYLEEKRASAETAQQAKSYAEDCEARARDWSDLAAQWQAATAATNAAAAARDQIRWTAGEIAALLVTIGVAAMAIWSAHRHSQRQLRPYLTNGPIKPQPMTREGVDGFDFIVVWKNTGATPATRILMRISNKAMIGDIPSDFSFPDIGVPDDSITSYLGPNQESHLSVFLPRAEILADRVAGRNRYIWSWAEYSDSTDPRKRRRSEICVRVEFFGPLTTIDKIGFTMVSKFNAMDHDCVRNPESH